MLSSQASSPVVYLIPAYKPRTNLLAIVENLGAAGCPIIIINDGSDTTEASPPSSTHPSQTHIQSQYEPLFNQLKALPNVHLCQHEKNQGKGAALKTGFAYYLAHFKDTHLGVVTLDADGQHLVPDVLIVGKALEEAPNTLILGVREFKEDIPFRSKFGNILTRSVFKYWYKIDVQDTQTGLRGIPNALIKSYLNLNQSGYDFETACLLETKSLDVPFRQVPITTVYEDNNACSHFNPVIDSIRIYFVFLRFTFLSLFCFLIDILIFWVLYQSTHHIFGSTLGSRIISGTTNFYMGKKMVFKSKNTKAILQEALSYTTLALILVFLSANLVTTVSSLFEGPIVLIKVLCDSFLFILSFCVQRFIIFKAKAPAVMPETTN